MLVKVTDVEAVGPFRLHVHFCDGCRGEVDLEESINARSGPIIEALKDPGSFREVAVDHGAPTWPYGYDICPVTLYDHMQHAGILRPPEAAA